MRKNPVISIIMIVVVAIVIAGAWILLSGGEQGTAADSPGESPGTQKGATERIADLRAQPGWEEPDWSSVEAAEGSAGMKALMEITHCLDVWHRGETPNVILVCDVDGVVHDGFGHAAQLSLPEWKDLLATVEESREQPMSFRTAPALYPFTLEPSDARRQLYEIQVGGRGELHVEWIRDYGD